jgi:phosphate transport system substrate-binding protein
MGRGVVKLLKIVGAMAASLVCVTGAFAVDLDGALPAYKTAGGLSGHMTSVGSDTLGNLMSRWAEGFKALYPGVQIEVESKGSSTAPPALVEGVAQIGPMSRPMDMGEIEAFTKNFGYPASSLPVAVDALAVYVNKDNPVQCVTLQQVDQIFSKDHWNSGGINIKTWGDAGLTGDWASRPISMFGRNSLSGTFEVFKESVLRHGDFKDELKQQPDSSTVVQMVAADKSAIGYSGIGYRTDSVRAVALADPSSGNCYEPSSEFANSGKYPLARYLRIYFNKDPKQPLDATVAEFIKYIISKDGQTITMKAGFYPISNALRTHSLQALGIQTDTN